MLHKVKNTVPLTFLYPDHVEKKMYGTLYILIIQVCFIIGLYPFLLHEGKEVLCLEHLHSCHIVDDVQRIFPIIILVQSHNVGTTETQILWLQLNGMIIKWQVAN
jgi:hypothetical protein